MRVGSLVLVVLLGLIFVVPALGQRLTAEEARKKIEENTPAALPQSPREAKVRTDVEDERLKGKVKAVITVREQMIGGVKDIQVRSEEEYDATGSLVRSVLYDWAGNPSTVSVYGWIDGKRVKKSKFIRNSYDPPPAAAAPGQTQTVPKVTRYDSSTEYKYDGQKRLIEKKEFWDDGELWGRFAYLHNGDKIQFTYFGGGDKLRDSSTRTYDKAGNEIAWSIPAYGEMVASDFKYASYGFDPHGNWTRRTVTGKQGKLYNGHTDISRVETRTITYYK